MLDKILRRLLERRHFWRYASFSEISELYTSRTLRVLAMSLGAGFTTVYLFKFGFSISTILLMWSIHCILRMLALPLSAKFLAYFGPKHGIFISNLLYIPALISLATLPKLGLYSVLAWGIFSALSSSLYVLCYYVDFSKVKNVNHAGKEMGYMAILEKLTLALAPVIGGLLALFFDPQTVMWVSAIVMAMAALPLMSTAEPTRTHQTINIKGFPWRLTMGSFISEVGAGFDVVSSNQVWNLFLVSVIFASAGGSVYLDIGSLTTITVIIGLIASYTYGKIVDTKKGRSLLIYSVLLNSLTHAVRPLAGTSVQALGVNISNEVATTGIGLSRLRGLFDVADISGHRILFFTILESLMLVGCLLACLLAYVLVNWLPQGQAFVVFYGITAIVVLIVGTTRFPVYER